MMNKLNCVGLILRGIIQHSDMTKLVQYGLLALAAIVQADGMQPC